LETDEAIRAVLADGPDVLAHVDGDGRILRFVAGRGYVGAAPATLIGRPVDAMLSPQDGARVRFAIAKVVAEQVPLDFEHERNGPTGPRTVRVRLVPAVDGGALAHIVDVTEQVRVRVALDESLERSRMIARATSDAIFDFDLVNQRIVWNERLESTFGYGEGVIVDGDSWVARIHPDQREEVRASALAAIGAPSRQVWSGEYRFAAADGRWRDVVANAFIVRDPTGRALRIVGSLLDVTEKKQLQARLRTAERLTALGALAAGLAHEVSGPLGSMAANVDLALAALWSTPVEDRPSAVARAVECLQDVARGAQHLRSLVADLKGVTRVDDETIAPLDLRRVVELAMKVTDHELMRRARVEVDLRPTPLVQGNAHRLCQVVVNLLVNALQAVPPDAHDGWVRVSLSTDGAYAVLAVEDSGPGISADVLPRLFEPFFTTKREGSGLGLAICSEIVKSHAGRIEVERAQPHGTRFRVLLPVAAAQARRERILVVDDDALTRSLVARILDGDHDVTCVASGADALAALRGGAFDVVLSDIAIPGMDGYALRAAVLAASPSMRFAFMSAEPDCAVADVPKLDKPFTPEALRGLVVGLRAR
jgi:two-component system, NtrC family, sensor kinase